VVWQGEPAKSLLRSTLVDDNTHRVQLPRLLQP
jgi:hypothetical protein